MSRTVGILYPAFGGSRTAAQELRLAFTRLGVTAVPFDYHRLVQQAGTLLKDPAPEACSDFASQWVTLRHLAEKIPAVIVPALTPFTRYFIQVFANAGIKTLYWAVEDFRLATEWAEVADAYYAVACIQKGEFEEKLKTRGCSRIIHLPHGTARQPGPATPKEYPVAFVGAPYPNRVVFFRQLLDQEIPLKIWGDGWDPLRGDPVLGPALMDTGRWLSMEEIFSIYQRSLVVLNLHSAGKGEPVIKPDGDFLNPRLFDAAASGSLQITDRRALATDAFAEDTEIVCFSTLGECAQKIRHYLGHPAEAAAIGSAGAVRCMREHTLEQRARKMMDVLGI